MTNELEKQFFDTFGIEKELNTCEVGRWDKCPNPKLCVDICYYKKSTKFYPQITDRILLEIIAKIMWSYSCTQNDFDAYEVSTAKDLKEAVLKHAIELSKNDDYIYSSVQALFEEG